MLLAGLLLLPARASAYSVFAHEAIVDAAWRDQMAPLLRRRFPSVTAAGLESARAYAYGGSLIQDLGYYPFGSRLFSNLVHYVRSGDFVEALLRNARDVNDYAFALGALAHYTSDNLGHPIAVNRAVPIVYPKLQREYGDDVLYVQSPARHLMVEFAFDVVQVARGAFRSDAYQNLIGFEVALPLLENATRETYGLELRDLFADSELAIGTYRRAVSRTIPEMTRLAWKEKKDEILAATPGRTEGDVVFTLTRRQYEERYGTKYRKPGLLARFVVLLFKVVPKFGPFKPLAFEPLTPEAERLFQQSFAASSARYRESLRAVASGRRLALRDTDLDTGRPAARGTNALADRTYADLLGKLAAGGFRAVPAALRQNINGYFAARRGVTAAGDRASRKHEQEIVARLQALNSAAEPTR